MRPIYVGFAANVLLVLLKYLASVNSNSASVNATLFHSLADLIFSALILVGTLSLKLKPSLRYPFGYGRTVYVAGFAAVLFAATYLLYNAVSEGLRKLEYPVIEVSNVSLVLIATSLSVNLLVLLDALVKSREKSHPALLATIAENTADVTGDSVALLALALGSCLLYTS
ncbi:MAG: cation transporter, partial [Sulfolobales archaeon]|nr:cation transporter [Sulfolobales archaeon]